MPASIWCSETPRALAIASDVVIRPPAALTHQGLPMTHRSVRGPSRAWPAMAC